MPRITRARSRLQVHRGKPAFGNALLLLAIAALGACDDRPSKTVDPMLDSSAAIAQSGAGRAAGAGRGGVRAAKPRPPPDQTAPGRMCGGQPCESPSPLIYACCLPDDRCGAGINSECRARMQPGMSDDRCPSRTAWEGQVELGGCCTPAGQCGLLSPELGLGCIERSELPAYLGGPLSARACADTDADADAGSSGP